jgi:eukaryotic-like serine/threonine-protein kinase
MECPACHTPNIDGARFCAKCGALVPETPTAEADPLIGAVVGGRFRIVGILGEGGMGRVYTGEQQMGTSVRKVAIKTLLSQYAKDPQVVARFMRECGTVSELEHPNTIKVYDFGQTAEGELYIAMELLVGASLEKALEGGALPPERVDRILSQICGSLQEAHDKGIVHRDLKPANIHLTTRAGEEDYVKVLDFGIAKRDDKHSKQEAKLTQQGTVLGTPPYMSPEQFRGQELDARSDIYSLGVVSYEMLTGRLPFDADTPWAWATQHMTAQPFPFETVPLGSAVPPRMKAAVMRALSKDKNQRHQSVKEFFEEFTMGAGRSSMAFGAPRTSMADMAPAGPVLGGAPTQATSAYPSGPQQGYPSGSMQHTPSSPGMGAAPGMYPSSPGMAVPAGAYPGDPRLTAPPPPVTTKSSAGLILGILGALALVGAGGGALVYRSRQARHPTSDSADAGAVTATTATTVVDAGKPPPEDDDAGPAGPPDPAITHLLPSTPTVHPEQECKLAEAAAARENIEEARHHLQHCEGPSKPAAVRSVELAERRLHPPPCRGRRCPR